MVTFEEIRHSVEVGDLANRMIYTRLTAKNKVTYTSYIDFQRKEKLGSQSPIISSIIGNIELCPHDQDNFLYTPKGRISNYAQSFFN